MFIKLSILCTSNKCVGGSYPFRHSFRHCENHHVTSNNVQSNTYLKEIYAQTRPYIYHQIVNEKNFIINDGGLINYSL